MQMGFAPFVLMKFQALFQSEPTSSLVYLTDSFFISERLLF